MRLPLLGSILSSFAGSTPVYTPKKWGYRVSSGSTLTIAQRKKRKKRNKTAKMSRQRNRS